MRAENLTMSPSIFTRLRALSSKIILRWSDPPSAPLAELPVEIVDEDNFEPIIRAPLKISEQTPVTLLTENFMVNGIVRSCRTDRNSFLLTIATEDLSAERLERAQFRDPGALVVDDFLTEEEEAKILEALQDSSPSAAKCSTLARIYRTLVSYVQIANAYSTGKQHVRLFA